jgi:hypothetical protein
MRDCDDDLLAAWSDKMLPGDGAFPSASAAINDFGDVRARLEASDLRWLAQQAPLAMDDPAQLARQDAAAFERVLAALYGVYYATAPVLEVVRELAQAGPRDDAALFDPALLGRVIKAQAGKRRL